MVIQDRISGQGVHHVAAVFPIHPQVFVNSPQDQRLMLYVNGHPVEVVIEGEGKLELQPSSYHPEFGRSVDNYQIVFSVQEPLPIEITTRIVW